MLQLSFKSFDTLQRSFKSLDTFRNLLKRADKVRKLLLKRAVKLGELRAYPSPTLASKLKEKFVVRQHRVTSLMAEPTPILSFSCQHGSEFVCVCVRVCVCACVRDECVYTYTFDNAE